MKEIFTVSKDVICFARIYKIALMLLFNNYNYNEIITKIQYENNIIISKIIIRHLS